MPDPIPAEAMKSAAEALAAYYAGPGGEPGLTAASFNPEARTAVEAAAPVLAAQVRRETAEQVAAALLAVDPVEWALAGQRAGQDAAEIARRAALPERSTDLG